MKKRLLSALLALVMVLALLPVSVFAEPDPAGEPPVTEETKETEEKKEEPLVTPVVLNNEGISVQTLGNAGSGQDGWPVTFVKQTMEVEGGKIDINGINAYYAHKKVNPTDKLESYYKVENGLIYSNKYYSSTSSNELPTSFNDYNFTVIGTGITATLPTNTTSATFSMYNSGSLSVSAPGGKLTSLTVKRDPNSSVLLQGTLTGSIPNSVTNLILENVDASGVSINDEGSNPVTSGTRKIKLTNSQFGSITMDGEGIYNPLTGNPRAVNAARQVEATNSSLGSINLTGATSTVKLTDCTVGSGFGTIEVASNGGSISIDGSSSVGNITIGAQEAKKTYPTVSIAGTATVGSILESNNPSKDTATASITIGGAGANVARGSGEKIEFNSANVTITYGHVGYVHLIKGGKVYLNGTSITVDAVSLEGASQLEVKGSYDANKADNVNNGAHNTIGNMWVKTTGNLTIPADPTNTFGSTTNTGSDLNGYSKKNILGGTWKFDVPKAALSPSLVYYLFNQENSPDTYTYYTANQLGSALNQQADAAKNSKNIVLRVVGQDYDTTHTGVYIGEVRFMNGITPWGKLQVTAPMQITLPNSINNVQVSSWTDGKQTYKLPNFYTVSEVTDMKLYDGTSYVELNASGGVNTGDVTKLTEVTVSSSDYVASSLRATLNGTVISLSGAVNSGTSTVHLILYTDAVEMKQHAGTATTNEPVKLEVDAIYFDGTGSLTFRNLNETALAKGLTLETVEGGGLGVLRLSNGTKYTLNGSGLKVRSNIKVANYDNYDITGYSYIEVSVNAPTIKTDRDKQTVIDMFTQSNPKGFDWDNSPAMNEAINAALASITQQQVDSWIAQVQREAWTKLNKGTYNAANNAPESGYDEVWLVPYLQVNVTGYSNNGTLTFTAVPSWRVEVRQTAAAAALGNAYCTAFFDAKKPENNLTNPKNAKVVKTGTSLGALTGNMGTNDVLSAADAGLELTINHNFGAGVYLHQDNTYAYTDNASKYIITHAGGSLGTMIINKNAPLVTLYASQTNGVGSGLLATYDNLQAAVNDVKDSQHINVDQAYKGSMNVSVSGNARKFTIQANGLNVVAANTTNGLVDLNSTGGLYTVQLNRDSTAVVDATSATIAVASVNNGSAVVSATTAKSGSTITVTCTPNSGYRTSSVGVSAHMTSTNTNVVVSTTRVSDNVYSFKVPQDADKITVTPNFAYGTAVAAVPFTDVATNHWAYNSVKYVYDNGLMNGVNTAGTQFGGTQTLNRAMVATILYRAAGSPYVGTTSNFSDVANNTWYSQAVAWASQNNIVTGYTNGTFQPNWAITRQELATMLYRYNTTYKGRATTGSTTLANFPDQSSVSDWATAGMQWAVGNGIVNGITNGVTTTLSPAGSATRYEAATMLMRYGQGMGL